MTRRPSVQTLMVLQTLLAYPDEAKYGLQVAQATGLRSGTVFPILARLADAGLAAAAWEDVDPNQAGRPRRRYYRLTRAGILYAERFLAEAERFKAFWSTH